MKIAKIELDNGFSFAIQDNQLPLTIGRSKSCDIRISEPFVSRQHCELYLEKGNTLCLKDMSANGTMVDNRTLLGETVRIDRPTHVTFADEIGLTVALIDDDGVTLVPTH